MDGPISEVNGANLGHSLPQVHDHTGSPKTTLLPHLGPSLPYTLPLYRRIQFGHYGQHTRIFATVPPAQVSSSSSSSASLPPPQQDHAPAQCIAATYIDRSRRPETESWMYVSWDHPAHRALASGGGGGETSCTCSAHLLSLLSHVAGSDDASAAVPYPPLTAAEETDVWAAVRATGAAEAAARHHAHTSAPAARYLEGLHAPALLKVGAMHATGVEWARRLGLLGRDGVGSAFAYRKYVFRDGGGGGGVDAEEGGRRRGGKRGEEEEEEEERGSAAAVGVERGGLSWGRLREEDLALVRSRTAIPKTHRTLRTLPSVAVFATEGDGEGGAERKTPVAWAFLAVDGSLSSLHVEPEYRGRGLAKAMGRKIFQEGWDAFGDSLNGLAHADVALDNAESNGVCKSLGGIDQDWHVYWVRIDLKIVREVVKASL